MTTCGCRPFASSVARAWLKYASAYQPARIFSTGRSNTAGARRLRVVITFELQARVQRGLGDLELLGSRVVGADAVLQLVTRPRERARERVRGVARHPRKISVDAAMAPSAPAARAAVRCRSGK